LEENEVRIPKFKLSLKKDGDVLLDEEQVDNEIEKIFLEKNKKNIEENEEESDDGGDVEFRDKDKELRESIAGLLSDDTQGTIKVENTTLEEIIATLQKRGLSKDKALEMVRMKNINKQKTTGLHRE
jgi:uncharacterized protein YeaC (DUF1315 family)